MAAEETFDLQRFVAVQQAVYAQVLDELTAGRNGPIGRGLFFRNCVADHGQ